MPLEAIMRTDEHHIMKHRQILGIEHKQAFQLVFLGDSITRRWEDNIEVWNKYFAPYHAANLGVGSDCLENIKWRILNGELEGFSPKIIIFLGGTNNLDSDPEETIASGIGEIVEIIQGKLKHTTVVVLGLLPRNRNETGIDYFQKTAAINRRLAARYAGTEVIFKDIGADLVESPGIVKSALMPDGLHLNGEGYEVIGPKLREIIEELWHSPSKSYAP